MKAKIILRWIVNECINGEHLNTIDVPNEGDNEWEQNEEWWLDTVGGVPPYPIPAGKYLYYSEAMVGDEIHLPDQHFDPDATIEMPMVKGWDYIYFYKIDD